jgi:histidinol-phosphatase (PHP family)
MMASAFEIHDVAFELNTNGRNRPLNDFYPDRKYLPLFAEHGVPVCVNSDAHFPERIGQFSDEAYELLKRSGYNEMAVFKDRERYMIPF